MSADSNKAAARRLIEEGLNKGNMAVLDEVLSAKYNDHAAPPGVPPTLDGFKMFFNGFRAAFPDLHYTIEREVGEGDWLVHYLTGHGTMKGDFQGMKATGKAGTWTEFHMGRFEGGKVVEHWATVDQLGMLVSVGVMPPPGQPPKM